LFVDQFTPGPSLARRHPGGQIPIAFRDFSSLCRKQKYPSVLTRDEGPPPDERQVDRVSDGLVIARSPCDKAIQSPLAPALDCFASLAMRADDDHGLIRVGGSTDPAPRGPSSEADGVSDRLGPIELEERPAGAEGAQLRKVSMALEDASRSRIPRAIKTLLLHVL
jgi:hypothetical protein